jgi:hypothetical protein
LQPAEGPTGSDGFQDSRPGLRRDLSTNPTHLLNKLALDVLHADETDFPTVQKRICPQEGVTGCIEAHLASLEVWPCQDVVRECRVDDEHLHIRPNTTDDKEFILRGGSEPAEEADDPLRRELSVNRG